MRSTKLQIKADKNRDRKMQEQIYFFTAASPSFHMRCRLLCYRLKQ
jgi:hypothetical protein